MVERDLELTGITAIEDKLQAGVPAAIETMLMAGIKVRGQLLCCEASWERVTCCSSSDVAQERQH